MMFNEWELLDRFEKAAELGFEGVEIQGPYGESAEDIADNIEEIRNIENGTYPLSNEDELMIIQQAIQGNQ